MVGWSSTMMGHGRRSKTGSRFRSLINDASSHPSSDDTVVPGGTEEEMLATPVMRGAFESLTRLCDAFEERVWIVSKAGPTVQARTQQWLAHHRCFETTGIDASHVRFCRRRDEKATICSQLGITHFVDDLYGGLKYLGGVVAPSFSIRTAGRGTRSRHDRRADVGRRGAVDPGQPLHQRAPIA